MSLHQTTTSWSSWIQRLFFSEEDGKASFMVADKLYVVEGMSYEMFEAWKLSHSVGTFFNRHIRNNYKISELHY